MDPKIAIFAKNLPEAIKSRVTEQDRLELEEKKAKLVGLEVCATCNNCFNRDNDAARFCIRRKNITHGLPADDWCPDWEPIREDSGSSSTTPEDESETYDTTSSETSEPSSSSSSSEAIDQICLTCDYYNVNGGLCSHAINAGNKRPIPEDYSCRKWTVVPESCSPPKRRIFVPFYPSKMTKSNSTPQHTGCLDSGPIKANEHHFNPVPKLPKWKEILLKIFCFLFKITAKE